jgi:hypothetical protein
MKLEQVRGIIETSQKTGYLPDGSRSCILCVDTCPDEPMYVGLWFPGGMQRRLGCSEERLSKGGGRIVLYQLCQECFDRPNKVVEVEDAILKRVTVQ